MNCHGSYSSLLTHLLTSSCGELFPYHTYPLCMCHLVSVTLSCFSSVSSVSFHVMFYVSPFCVIPILTCFLDPDLGIPFWPFHFHVVFRTFFGILHSFLKHVHSIFLFCFILRLFCLLWFSMLYISKIHLPLV